MNCLDIELFNSNGQSLENQIFINKNFTSNDNYYIIYLVVKSNSESSLKYKLNPFVGENIPDSVSITISNNNVIIYDGKLNNINLDYVTLISKSFKTYKFELSYTGNENFNCEFKTNIVDIDNNIISSANNIISANNVVLKAKARLVASNSNNENINIQMKSSKGVTLATKNKYVDKNISIIPTLQTKEVTENGLVSTDDGYVGLSQVNVNVPKPTLVGTASPSQVKKGATFYNNSYDLQVGTLEEGSQVISVNGKTGAVVLTLEDLGASKVATTNNYNDLDNRPTVYNNVIEGNSLEGVFDKITPQLQDNTPDSSKYMYWLHQEENVENYKSPSNVQNESLLNDTDVIEPYTNEIINDNQEELLVKDNSKENLLEDNEKEVLIVDNNEESLLNENGDNSSIEDNKVVKDTSNEEFLIDKSDEDLCINDINTNNETLLKEEN